MNKSQMIQERKTLIEGYWFAIFKPMPYFDSIKYAKDPNTDGEYIRFSTKFRNDFFDITAMPEMEINADLSRLMTAALDKNVAFPESRIKDTEKALSVSRLF